MQPVWLCISPCKLFEDPFENTHWRKVKLFVKRRLRNSCHPVCVIFVFSGFEPSLIRKSLEVVSKNKWNGMDWLEEKKITNATGVTLQPSKPFIWRGIWKCTVEKSQTNAACVILHPLRQASWGYIWRRTLEIRQTNAISVILHALIQVLWADIWKDTVGKSRTAWCVTDWLINQQGRCWRCYCINHWIKWITWEDVSKILHLRPNKDDDKYPDNNFLRFYSAHPVSYTHLTLPTILLV